MRRVSMIAFFVVVLLASPATSQPAGSQPPDDHLIIPGQRIGTWTLEMTIETLLQANGPQNTGPGSPGAPVMRMAAGFSDSNGEIWWHEWSNRFFSAATRGRDAQRVEYIFVWSEDFKTDKNIAPGMLRSLMESIYGQPTAVTRTGGLQNPGGLRLIYDEIGLAATISRNGIVEMLFVFRPKTARTLWNF